jgi:hypothetical protein
MARKLSHDGRLPGDGQPPTKKVFTEKHLQAASTPIKRAVVEPIATNFSLKNASPSAAATATIVDKKTRAQRKEEKQAHFRAKIEVVFPDICEEYVKHLYAKYEPLLLGIATETTGVLEQALEDILEQPSYPKKIQKKRKRMSEAVTDSVLKEIQSNSIYYIPIVCVYPYCQACYG